MIPQHHPGCFYSKEGPSQLLSTIGSRTHGLDSGRYFVFVCPSSIFGIFLLGTARSAAEKTCTSSIGNASTWKILRKK